MDEAATERVLSHAVPSDWSFYQRPGRVEVQHTMPNLRDKATGPDGVPYSAWQAGGSLAADCIMDLMATMMEGQILHVLNDALYVFVPKPDGEAEDGAVSAEATRPLALKHSGVKIATSVVSGAVRPVMTANITEAAVGGEDARVASARPVPRHPKGPRADGSIWRPLAASRCALRRRCCALWGFASHGLGGRTGRRSCDGSRTRSRKHGRLRR